MLAGSSVTMKYVPFFVAAFPIHALAQNRAAAWVFDVTDDKDIVRFVP